MGRELLALKISGMGEAVLSYSKGLWTKTFCRLRSRQNERRTRTVGILGLIASIYRDNGVIWGEFENVQPRSDNSEIIQEDAPVSVRVGRKQVESATQENVWFCRVMEHILKSERCRACPTFGLKSEKVLRMLAPDDELERDNEVPEEDLYSHRATAEKLRQRVESKSPRHSHGFNLIFNSNSESDHQR
ncbi:hypothetical protein B0H12DRAFT_1312589 [Mycena haematopus]|nr:hypothetical protein B0H12DRAFT_1312589 [Mycena haematopus]